MSPIQNSLLSSLKLDLPKINGNEGSGFSQILNLNTATLSELSKRPTTNPFNKQSVNNLTNTLAMDERSLDGLKNAAINNDPAALRQVAAEFESLFISILLQNMRSVEFTDPSERSNEMNMYVSIFDQQLSSILARSGGIGLSELISNQLEGKTKINPANSQQSVVPSVPFVYSKSIQSKQQKSNYLDLIQKYNEENQKGVFRDSFGGYENKSNADFTKEMLTQALPAATALGVSPHLIVAHAALESGWGKNYIKTASGANSHNLFGIKATPDWKGATATVWTTEFRNGVPRRERATFRAYPTYAHAFADYARLLMKNDRYKDALNRGSDAVGFARALAKGGYATDPMYAKKLSALASSAKILKAKY